MDTPKKILSEKEMLQRLVHYCARREHSLHEAVTKLEQIGATPSQIETITAKLIQHSFINNERFALLYARSKLRQNQWGRYKIRQGLQKHQIDRATQSKALQSLDEEEYIQVLNSLFLKKTKAMGKIDTFAKKQKLQSYLAQCGFENQLIIEITSKSQS